jgi:hypothetical protein
MFDNENSDTIVTDTNILRAAVAAVLLVAPMFFSEFDSKFFINTIMKDINIVFSTQLLNINLGVEGLKLESLAELLFVLASADRLQVLSCLREEKRYRLSDIAQRLNSSNARGLKTCGQAKRSKLCREKSI